MRVFHVTKISDYPLMSKDVEYELASVEVFPNSESFNRYYELTETFKRLQKEYHEANEFSDKQLDDILAHIQNIETRLKNFPKHDSAYVVPKDILNEGFCYDVLPTGSLEKEHFQQAVLDAVIYHSNSSNRS